MSTQLQFNGFQIKKINYNLDHGFPKDIGDSYILNFDLNEIKLSFSEKNDKIRVNVSANIECKKNKTSSSFRSLQLAVDYFYRVFNNDETSNLRELAENYGINNSIILFENLVKDITSLDYCPPIIFKNFKFPKEIKLIDKGKN